jgi:hypothetical protein
MATDAPQRPAPSARQGIAAALLGLGLFTLYTANGRAIGAGDVVPATFLAVALTHGDGPYLDRFDHVLREPDGRLPGYATDARGHAVSRYPIGPALVASPLVWPQRLAFDLLEPGWASRPDRARFLAARMGKTAASALTALAAVLLWWWLRSHVSAGVALAATLAASLGSGCWPVASQALWQHGPAVLCLTLALVLLDFPRPSRFRLALAGFAAALLVACRPIDLVFAGVLALWVLTHHPRPARIAFFTPAILGAVALASYQLYFFDTLTGGYAAIEKMHPWAHGTRGTFTGSVLNGGLGTLFSPSHGLLVYSPWVALALLGLGRPAVRRRLRTWPLLAWMLPALVPNFALLATYSCWWGGHCFGPRFWIDSMPLLAGALAVGLDTPTRRPRLARAAFAACLTLAVAVQVVGALSYPSTWHGSPTNSDRDHARLWDWRDNELTRGLSEGIHPRAW